MTNGIDAEAHTAVESSTPYAAQSDLFSTKGLPVHDSTRYGISPLAWCAQSMTKLLQWAAVVTMFYATAVSTPAISRAAADGQCADVEVIFARGTPACSIFKACSSSLRKTSLRRPV